MDDRFMYSVSEAAKHLSLSRPTLYALLKNGVIGHVRLSVASGGNSKIRIPKEELESFVKKSMTYGYTPEVPEDVKERRVQGLRKAREVKLEKATKKASTRKLGAFLDNPEGTIYVLNLKPRTFNMLWKAGRVKLDDVDISNKDIAKELVSMRGFGVSCYSDLERKLNEYHRRKAASA